MPRPKSDTDQLLLRLDRDLIERLRAEADRFGYESGSKVGAEIIERYLEFWLATKEAEFQALADQKALLSGKASAPGLAAHSPQQGRKGQRSA